MEDGSMWIKTPVDWWVDHVWNEVGASILRENEVYIIIINIIIHKETQR